MKPNESKKIATRGLDADGNQIFAEEVSKMDKLIKIYIEEYLDNSEIVRRKFHVEKPTGFSQPAMPLKESYLITKEQLENIIAEVILDIKAEHLSDEEITELLLKDLGVD